MAFRSASTGIGNSTAVSASVPAGVAANDIVLAICNYDSNTFTITWNNGFTLLRTDTHSGPDGERTSYAWKRAGGSEGATYGATISSAIDWTVIYCAFSGRDTGTNPTISSANINTSANASPVTVTALGLTAATGDDLAWLAGLDVNATGIGNGFTPPASYTERGDIEQAFANCSVATLDNASVGATGSISGMAALTSGGAGWAAALIQMPVAGGGGGVTVKQLAAMGVG